MPSPITFQSLELFHQSEQSLLYRHYADGKSPPLVVKVLNIPHPSNLPIQRFYNEYEMLKGLNLEGVRKAVEKTEIEGRPAILLEHVEGMTLREAFVEKEQSLEVFLQTAVRIAGILGDVHRQNIIHKDICSDNILLHLSSGVVKIIDFGLATRLNIKSSFMGNPERIEGNLRYISPEQSGRMNRTVDYRTDFYSLGVTLYEMLTGRLPFEEDDPLELVHCHLAKTPRPPHEWAASSVKASPQLPVVSDIILKLLSKNAEDRYQSAFGLQADLETCLQVVREKGDLTPFPLAQRDFSEKFHIPQKLYGRERELSILKNAYKSISQGKAQLLLVSGYSGVGKSSLVYEIHQPLTENRGYFIEGKFDQFQRNIPYYAWIQAFEDFVSLLLTENQSKLEAWKEKLVKVLDNQGKVLTDIIPSLEIIIGPQPDVPKLNPTENQNRFNRIFKSFVRAVAREGQPLFIFIDDWQWTDSTSLNLLEMLMSEEENQYLMITGAYRDNEVNEDHPFTKTIKKLKRLAVPTLEISLNNLSKSDINQLIADSLKCPPDYCRPLSDLLHAKTRGNPFFLRQTLQSLYEKQRLKLKHLPAGDIRWHWDMEEIQQLKITDNVVDLMVEKALQLPKPTQKVLRLASCIGTLFPLPVLSALYQQPEKRTYDDLFPALEEGLVMPAGKHYTFSHDRIQQAVYSLISEKNRNQFHYEIGKLLQKKFTGSEETTAGGSVFDTVNHLNFGRHMVKTREETLRLARLNLRAGVQAKNATAYEPALHYLQIGKSLLPDNSWTEEYELSLGLHRHLAECEALCFNFQRSEELFRMTFKHARHLEEKIEVASLQLWLSWWVGKWREGTEIGKQALRLCRIDFPDTEEELLSAIEVEEADIEQIMKNKRLSDLRDLPEMTDKHMILATRLLSRLVFMFYIWYGHDSNYRLAVLMGIRLCLKYGRIVQTAVLLVHYCALLAGRDRYRQCYELALIAVDIANFYPHFHEKAQFLNRLGLWGIPYGEHLENSFELFEKGYQIGVETGNIPHAATCRYDMLLHLIAMGKPLTEVSAFAEKVMVFFKEIGYQSLVLIVSLDWHLVHNLMDGKQEHDLSEYSFNIDEEQSSLAISIANGWLGLNRLQKSFWMGDFQEALTTISEFEPHIKHATPNIKWADHDFYAFMALTGLFENFPAQQKAAYQKDLDRYRHRMQLKAEACPDNFLHKDLLMEAELARLGQRPWQAVEAYNKAIETARQYRFLHIEALGNELMAKFWHGLGYSIVAETYFQRAYQTYQRWEARAVAQRLADAYPFYFAHLTPRQKASGSDSITELDIVSLLKASQILSREVVLSNLLAKMMQVVLENAGAEKGILIEHKDGRINLKVRGSAGGKVEMLQEIPFEESKDLPVILINYVVRTLKPLILDNASDADKFSHDLYIQSSGPKSVLCFPILIKKQLSHIFYLENNLATGVFTDNHLRILEALSSQIGISIENALLYQDLEQSLEKQVKLTEEQVKIKDAYGKFVPHTFLKTLGHDSILDVRLGDQVQGEICILFSDIRDYTTLSESMTPKENFNFLNAYLRRVGPAIKSNRGFVSQYHGDGIMALFLNQPEDALKAAIEMQLAVGAYNEERIKKDRTPIKVGVGIHAGSLMLGIIGDEHHMQASVVSDAVNTASRLEGLTKLYHAAIIISGKVMSRIEDIAAYHCRFLGKVQVKGKKNTVSIYEVFDSDPPDLKEKKQKGDPDFQKGLEHYFAKDFIGAATHFKQALQIIPDDKVIQRYLQNAARLMIENVPPDWTGAEVIVSK